MCNNNIMKTYTFYLENIYHPVLIKATRLDQAIKILNSTYGSYMFESIYYTVDSNSKIDSRILPRKYRIGHAKFSDGTILW